MIPLVGVGPWALWPTFADLAVGFLAIIAFFTAWPASTVSEANKTIFRWLLLSSATCAFSFLATIWLGILLERNFTEENRGLVFGYFQIYRLAQFVFVFWAGMRIPLDKIRLKVLRLAVTGVFLFVCLGVFLTYSGILPTATLVRHLPMSWDVAGPWYRYQYRTDRGETESYGTIGYDHIYVAIQVLLLASLQMHLGMSFEQNKLWDNILLLIAILTIFIAESRAGLAAVLIFAASYWVRRPRDVALVVIVVIILVPLIASATALEESSIFTTRTLERAVTLLQPTEAESLSGRDQIWAERIAYLNEQPIRWLTGVGFGMAKGIGSGSTAHMTYLHVLFETGFGGLLVFLALAWRILRYLWQNETGTKPLFWASIGLFISAVAQETFYPLPSLGHFLGFYFAALAITLGEKSMPHEYAS